jgi:hypothetical protein
MRILRVLVVAALLPAVAVGGAKPLFEQDFSKVDLNQVPADFLVLDGQFAVKEEGGNRFLELPGAPLDTFGALFGPSAPAGLQVSGRILSTKQGRKFPIFGVGVNGVPGFRLQVAPAKKALELFKGEELKLTVPFDWQSGEWTQFKLQIRKVDGAFKVDGKVWQGAMEPKDWQVRFEDKDETPAGRPAIWGMPVAGTPIRYDDLKVTAVE